MRHSSTLAMAKFLALEAHTLSEKEIKHDILVVGDDAVSEQIKEKLKDHYNVLNEEEAERKVEVINHRLIVSVGDIHYPEFYEIRDSSFIEPNGVYNGAIHQKKIKNNFKHMLKEHASKGKTKFRR